MGPETVLFNSISGRFCRQFPKQVAIVGQQLNIVKPLVVGPRQKSVFAVGSAMVVEKSLSKKPTKNGLEVIRVAKVAVEHGT